MKKILLTLSSLILLCYSNVFGQVTFNYTGAVQTYTVPPCVTLLTVSLSGAAGGTASESSFATSDVGGDGGSVSGTLVVVPGQVLNIYVGGRGQDGSSNGGGGLGGWNGGGFGEAGYSGPPWTYFGAGGGGASDIRVGGVALANRVAIAGGGGGGAFNYFACCNYDRGGAGGALTGAPGWSGNVPGGTAPGGGGTQVAGGTGGTWGGYCTAFPGTLGNGGNGCVSAIGNAGGGGGGGYYGGGAGCWAGGGGGSNYVTGLASVITDLQGTQLGDGVVTITPAPAGPAMTLSFNPVVNPTCNQSNGSATVNVVGGVPPYTYLWTPTGQTTATATGLSAGTYTVTVTDQPGCSTTASITLTDNAPVVNANVTANDPCFGNCVGVAIANVAGGLPPYTYNWTPSGGTSANATGLCAGSYTVTVTDANNCTGTATVTITQPTLLVLAPTWVNVSCLGPNSGSINSNPSGGTPAYTYAWTPNVSTGANATGLTAGTYSVNVTDANGCQASASVTITQPPPLSATISFSVNVSCFGGSNGSATVTAAGGNPAYTYQWTPVGGTNATASNLTAGTYTAQVTDASGCTATTSIVITQPALLVATMLGHTNVLCGGDSSGTATVKATGGTPSYTYNWLPYGGTNAVANNLLAGNYTVNVTDANGCQATAFVTLTQPPALILADAGFPTTCNGGSDGQATVIPSGGTPGYTYSWSNGGNTPNINNLTAGKYIITVFDANGCSKSDTVTVNQPAPIVAAIKADSLAHCAPLCVNFTDLSSDANAGRAIIHWEWNFGDHSTDTVKNPKHCYIAPGLYNVSLTVTDNKGCTSTITVPNMINVYSFPIPSFSMSPQPTTILDPEIQFTDKSRDQYGPISTWYWSFNDPKNTQASMLRNPTHKYSDTGLYCATLTVSNKYGCFDSITQCLVISNNYTLYIPDAFSPNGDGINDVFLPKGGALKSFQLYIFDRWGTLLYTTTDFNKGWDGSTKGGNIAQADTYVYLIEATDNQGNSHRYMGKLSLLR